MCVCACVLLLSTALLGYSWLLISDQGQLVLISCTLYIELFVVHSLSDCFLSISVSIQCSPVSRLLFTVPTVVDATLWSYCWSVEPSFTEELCYSLWIMFSFDRCLGSQSAAHCSPCAAEEIICTPYFPVIFKLLPCWSSENKLLCTCNWISSLFLIYPDITIQPRWIQQVDLNGENSLPVTRLFGSTGGTDQCNGTCGANLGGAGVRGYCPAPAAQDGCSQSTHCASPTACSPSIWARVS